MLSDEEFQALQQIANAEHSSMSATVGRLILEKASGLAPAQLAVVSLAETLTAQLSKLEENDTGSNLETISFLRQALAKAEAMAEKW